MGLSPSRNPLARGIQTPGRARYRERPYAGCRPFLKNSVVSAPKGSRLEDVSELLDGLLDNDTRVDSLATDSLNTIKTAIDDNPLQRADYPGVCVPVRAL